MKFSIFLPQGTMNELANFADPAEAYENMTRIAQVAEEVGFAGVWVADVLSGGPQQFLFESWTTTAAIARDTSRIRVGQLVTNYVFRNPALLAKMASTVDVLSHGRLTLGLGSGSPMLEASARAYGYDYPELPVRMRQLRESLEVIQAMWTQDEATFEGKYYQVRGAINQPKGAQQPHIPLLVAGNGEQVALKLVAQYADIGLVHGDPATLKHKFGVLKQHCETLGRDYEHIQRITGTSCILEDTDEQAQTKTPERTRAMYGDSALIGSPTTVRARIAAFADAGAHELVLRFSDMLDPAVLRRFAREFIKQSDR